MKQILLNPWQITTAPADAPMIASQLDLGPATGAAPSGTPTNNTTVPAHVLEIASPLDLGRAGATAPRQKPTQQTEPRDDPGAPRPLAWQPVHRTGKSINCLHLWKPKPLMNPLAETADLGEIVTPIGETPAQASAASAPDKPASKPTSKKKKKNRRKNRPPWWAGNGGPRGASAGVARRIHDGSTGSLRGQ